MFELTDKVAIVTGGAVGIGRGIALALAGQGADIAIADISPEQASDTLAEIEKLGRRAVVIKCDVTRKEEVDRMVQEVLDTLGKIDILVNNAGWYDIDFFSQSTPEMWDKTIDIDFKGVLYCTRAVLDHMIGRNYGRIINIGSEAGKMGSFGQSIYSACKGAVAAFAKAVAREVARNQITVNTVCPGPIMTARLEKLSKESDVAAKIVAAMNQPTPLKRWGTPEDIGSAVAFLASDEADFITGQALSVSGGVNMS
jgi:2-hydroxycyclohexanecarboxyl-CoA dehydrogenase